VKIDHCEFPDSLLYDVEQGTWAKADGEVVRVGVTSIISWSYGAFSSVAFRGTGTELRRGQTMGTMEGSRHFDVFRAPVSGTLTRVNERLVENPGIMNRDPYGEGWYAEIRVKSANELSALGTLPEVADRLAQILKERNLHCYAAFPDFQMFDMGVECQAVLVQLNQVMERSTRGTVVLVVSDDNTAEIEMQRWSEQTGNLIVDQRKEGSLYHFVVRKS
jgi:glycine cleavage system H lipoate-binding protein/TusA-related sulfurtransferase